LAILQPGWRRVNPIGVGIVAWSKARCRPNPIDGGGVWYLFHSPLAPVDILATRIRFAMVANFGGEMVLGNTAKLGKKAHT
jgi:hypothetical protein